MGGAGGDVDVVGKEEEAGVDEKPTGDLAAGILRSEVAGGGFESVMRRVNEETGFFFPVFGELWPRGRCSLVSSR